MSVVAGALVLGLRSGELLVTCCEATTAADREVAVATMTDEEHASDRVIHEKLGFFREERM